jgi:cell division protein FtsL
MRTLFYLTLVVIALVIAGVVHISKNGDSYNVTIDKNRLQQVEQEAIQASDKIIENAKADVQSASIQGSSPR